MKETILLNETAVCNRCKCEYLPEYSFHKDNGICDDCIEHEIDRVYGERGDPWADESPWDLCFDRYKYTCSTECDSCGKEFIVDADCLYSDSMYHCQECTKELMTEEPTLYVRCVKCGNIHYTHHVGVDREKRLCRYCSDLPLEQKG